MENVMQSLKGLGPLKIITFGLIAIILLLTLFFLSSRLTSPVMSTLYNDLSGQDSTKVISQLESMGVKYEVRNGGAQILVPGDQVAKVRMSMAQSGIPSQGSVVGYEIFDKS